MTRQSNEKNAKPGAGIRVSQERLKPFHVIGAYFATALFVFAAIPAWVLYSIDALSQGILIHPKVVLLVHLYALGWGGFVALGALRQLAPVVFQVPLSDDSRWYKAGFWGMATGFALFAAGFMGQRYAWVGAGGALMTIAFAVNFFAVAAAVRGQSRRSVIQLFVLPAALSLVLVGAVGSLIALHRVTGVLGTGWTRALATHLYLGPLGFYGFLIPGVTYELAPFFGLTRGGDDKGLGKYERVVLALLIVGFVAGWGSALLGRHHPLLMLPISIGLIWFVFDLRGIFRRRDPIRRTATLTGLRAAHLYLVAIAGMIAVGAVFPHLWSSPSWIRAFAWLAAAGWLSNVIVGYLHRILPFVAWHNRYWGKPKEEIRTRFQDMVSQRLGKRGFYVYNAGVILAILTFAWPSGLMVACGLLGAGAWILTFNLGRVYVR